MTPDNATAGDCGRFHAARTADRMPRANRPQTREARRWRTARRGGQRTTHAHWRGAAMNAQWSRADILVGARTGEARRQGEGMPIVGGSFLARSPCGGQQMRAHGKLIFLSRANPLSRIFLGERALTLAARRRRMAA